jgi:hypothetical protein
MDLLALKVTGHDVIRVSQSGLSDHLPVLATRVYNQAKSAKIMTILP